MPITQQDREVLAAAVRDSFAQARAAEGDAKPMRFTSATLGMIANAVTALALAALDRAKLHAGAEVAALRDELADARRQLAQALAEIETRNTTFERRLSRHAEHLQRLEDARQRERAA